MKVIIIQPPLVQLNCPYPSGAYLCSFFKKTGFNATWLDLSNTLFNTIFCREELTNLFNKTSDKALKLADKAEKNGDEYTAFNLRRYVSTQSSWIKWIDFIKAILCEGEKTSGREVCHRFIFSPDSPRGNRMENFLAGLENEPSVDDAKMLASMALVDLADYITAVYDSNFSLIRYAEAVSIEEKDFSQIKKELDSPVLTDFFKTVLENSLDKIKNFPDNQTIQNENLPEYLFLISMPFAGTYIPGLYAARFFKQTFGAKALIAIGGGFVNTELRDASHPEFADFIDFISYDRGYGSYHELINALCNKKPLDNLYKLKVFEKASDKNGNKIQIHNAQCMDLHDCPKEEIENHKDAIVFEEQMTMEIIPDYSDIDFSLYPRVCDDKNPMHRLWNDGTWIKAYLAHGCYWHKCAFCDVKLDYVCGYKLTKIDSLYDGLLKTASEKGVYGIHFVDEALPPVQLKQFALKNIQNQNKLYYWGNVRFEKTFTRDFADFLSYSGFGGVSAGIEVATGKGLSVIHKGTDLDSIVCACAAFKEAGILVHSYMIYGYWSETDQDLIDSMETLRQFFEQGLLDSAFWHKFTLTKNSRIYDEWKKGMHPALVPFEKKDGLHFKGEEKSLKYGNALDAALNSWMHGEKIEMNVRKWFDFSMPAPSIPKDYIQKAIDRYEKKTNKLFNTPVTINNIKDYIWIGSKPFLMKTNSQTQKIGWFYMQQMEEYEIPKDFSSISEKIVNNIYMLNPNNSGYDSAIDFWSSNKDYLELLPKFRGRGLCCIKL